MNCNSVLINIKKNIKGFSLSQTSIKFKSNFHYHNFYENKLDNSICRAKSNLYDLTLNNLFDFFVTLTLSDKHKDKTLNELIKNFNSRLKYMRKKGFSDLRYILIPEKHKNRNLALSRLFQWWFWC